MKCIPLLMAVLISATLAGQEILDTVTVTASRSSSSWQQATRTVTVYNRAALADIPTKTLNETLESHPSIDVRQRGPLDIQADVSIRGSTFDQTLVLINGIRMNDPQTGHHMMNLPIALGLVEHVEVLEGGAARIYGPNAFAGAINLTLPTAGKNWGLMDVMLGENALLRGDMNAAYNLGKWYVLGNLSFSSSKGYIANTDFNLFNAFTQAARSIGRATLTLNAGYNTKQFGAQNFYSSRYPQQFEATKTYFASAQLTGGKTWKYKALAYWRQHNDRFELFRETNGPYRYTNGFFIKNEADTATYVPGVFAAWNYYPGHNHHRTRVTGAEGQLKRTWKKGGTTTFGLDYRNEQIVSNNLGKPMAEPINITNARGAYTKSDARDNYSLYAEHRLQRTRFYATGGALINYNAAFGWDVMPGIDIGYRTTTTMLLYAGIDRSFRLPTFTDLYYNLGGARGSSTLQPEYSLNYELGSRWFFNQIHVQTAVFRREGNALIDWVQWTPDSVHAENITALNTNGFTVHIHGNTNAITTGWIKNVSLGYTFISAANNNPEIQSIYVLDYLRHKAVGHINHKLFFENLTLNWRFTYQNRAGTYLDYATGANLAYPDFWLADVRLAYFFKRFRTTLYSEVSNLFNQPYIDRGNVQQPGIWLSVGIRIHDDLF